MYEICILTPNGSIIGSFDDPAEANGLYKFAKENKYDIITRKICNGHTVSEKRFIENEKAFKSGIDPSVYSLKDAISRLEMEAT